MIDDSVIIDNLNILEDSDLNRVLDKIGLFIEDKIRSNGADRLNESYQSTIWTNIFDCFNNYFEVFDTWYETESGTDACKKRAETIFGNYTALPRLFLNLEDPDIVGLLPYLLTASMYNAKSSRLFCEKTSSNLIDAFRYGNESSISFRTKSQIEVVKKNFSLSSHTEKFISYSQNVKATENSHVKCPRTPSIQKIASPLKKRDARNNPQILALVFCTWLTVFLELKQDSSLGNISNVHFNVGSVNIERNIELFIFHTKYFVPIFVEDFIVFPNFDYPFSRKIIDAYNSVLKSIIRQSGYNI